MTKKKTNSSQTELVRELADILQDAGLAEIEYATEQVEIRLAKTNATTTMTIPQTVATTSNPEPAQETIKTTTEHPNEHPGALKSPMVGTAYLAPEPGAPDFIKLGDSVKSGQTLLIIEAMKVMNPITATSAGIVKSILVDNAQPVEYGQVLVIIE